MRYGIHRDDASTVHNATGRIHCNRPEIAFPFGQVVNARLVAIWMPFLKSGGTRSPKLIIRGVGRRSVPLGWKMPPMSPAQTALRFLACPLVLERLVMIDT